MTLPSRLSLRTGTASAGPVNGQLYSYQTPRLRKSVGLRPVMYLHGATGTAVEMTGSSGLYAARQYAYAMTDLGYSVVSVTCTELWNNATCQARIAAGLAWARAELGCSDDPAILIGGSMGANNALGWAADHPADVACIVGVIPLLSLQYARVANPLMPGYNARASIDAAWGVTYPAALPAGADPWDEQATLATIPIQLWYASNDTVTSDIGTFAANTGADVHDVGALGHTAAAMAAVDIEAMQDFITDAVAA
jgi:pimeloyl-ACP methyl ester carboxylesterase